ncbi:MAG: 30S ribosomal protein S9 [Caldisericales bacterium]|nr:30S ribosomal protein S9 [Caldisericales bacterium]
MYRATGYRKTAIASVIMKPGEGKIEINGREFEHYFQTESHRKTVLAPLEATGKAGKMDITVKVMGSGVNSQAEAVRHGIARALLEVDAEFRPSLKKPGFLRRDARKKERRKYGMRGARKARQYRKR